MQIEGIAEQCVLTTRGIAWNMAGIRYSGMVELVSRSTRPRWGPVTVIRASFWWLLKILCSHAHSGLTQCLHLLLVPAPRLLTHVWAEAAGPNRLSGLLHIPMLLSGDLGSSCTYTCWLHWLHSHLLPVPTPITPHCRWVWAGPVPPVHGSGSGDANRKGAGAAVGVQAGAQRMGLEPPLCPLQTHGPQFL